MLEGEIASAFLDPTRHKEALSALAARYLARDEFHHAFMFADRLCRLSRELDERALLLRCSAYRGLGENLHAAQDLEKAAALDPLDPIVLNLQFADAETTNERLAISKAILVNADCGRGAKLAALGAFWDADYDAISRLTIASDRISGWIAWKGRNVLSLSFAPNAEVELWPDQSHVLSGPTSHCATIDLQATTTGEPLLHTKGDRSPVKRYAIDRYQPARNGETTIPASVSKDGVPAQLSVVVPLFEAPRLTSLCLARLAQQSGDFKLRVILVLDNPDSRRMREVAESAAARFGFELLKNDRTIGFAAAVNRGLAASACGSDVVLLNSDVLLPPLALERLRRTACASVDIGTVTPLSNNGEELSFPSPFAPANLGSYRSIKAIDAVASALGIGPVPLPNGIGFCLYVTRRLIDRIGFLPELYDRGYYEDVEFCLRGAAEGLRNVCAPDVYVGHKGSSSFRGEKRALVVRNRKLLEGRFPTYGKTSAAFLAADPLKAARGAIEFVAGPARKRSCLFLVPPGRSRPHLTSMGLADLESALFASWTCGSSDLVDLFTLDGSSPQSLSFEGEVGRRRLGEYLLRAGIQTLRLLGPCLDQRSLVEHLHAAGVSIEIVCEDSFLQLRAPPFGSSCAVENADGPCPDCAKAFNGAMQAPKTGVRAIDGLGAVIRLAKAVRPNNAMADTVVRRLGLSRDTSELFIPTERNPIGDGAHGNKLGILVSTPTPAVERLIDTLLQRDLSPSPVQVVVFGEMLDDVRLMSSGQAFVCGRTDPSELGELLRVYRIGALFAPMRWSGYGELERLGSGVPWAYFDWSGGAAPKRTGDLELDPRLCDRKVIHKLRVWINEGPLRQGLGR